jgi:DNA-binding NarL/FixJ family response regulator
MGLPGNSATVMIVDDEADSLRMLSAALESAGISVLVATSGKAAIDLLGHILPDLIIMDAVMPGMDGFETTARIKLDPRYSSIPIVFMTGLTQPEHVVEAFEAGGVDYVRKPVVITELLARVRTHMAQGRAVQASMASLDATGRMMMAIDAQGNLLWCTPRAERVIADMAPQWRRSDGALPPEICNGVARLLARRDSVGSSLRIEQARGGGALELMVIARYRENEILIRLNELNPEQDVAKLRDRQQLTQREAEVLLWVSYGKSSSDISDVLAISPRTVQKHLERIYEKLGVETRSAAAAIAIRAIGQ